MESFVLSETLKVSRPFILFSISLTRQYLYLLFDEAPSSSLSNAVFTTEGHSLSLPHHLQLHPSPIRRELHRGEQQFCSAYRPPTLNGLRVGIEQREDWEYGRSLIYDNDLTGANEERKFWSPGGYCAVPHAPKFVSPAEMIKPDGSLSMLYSDLLVRIKTTYHLRIYLPRKTKYIRQKKVTGQSPMSAGSNWL